MKGPYIYGSSSLEEVAQIIVAINTFTGSNGKAVNMIKAVELAKSCPSLKWLCDAFKGGVPNAMFEVLEILVALTDAGMFYAHGLVIEFQFFEQIPIELTELAAEYGCPISQCVMYEKTKNEYWIRRASWLKWPKGQLLLGIETNDVSFIVTSAKSGHVDSMERLIEIYDDDRKWYWVCKVCLAISFISSYYVEMIEGHLRNCESSPSVCQIGYMLKGKFKWADIVYREHCQIVKYSIYSWSICARRLNICKDIRILISRKIWEGRVTIL